MGISEAFYNFWDGLIDFQGHSPRSEFWWDILMFLILFPIAISSARDITSPIISEVLGTTLTSLLFNTIHIAYDVLMLVPMFSLLCRRYHDAGYHGNWVFTVAILSVIISIIGVLTVFDSNQLIFILALLNLIVIIGNAFIGLKPTKKNRRILRKNN